MVNDPSAQISRQAIIRSIAVERGLDRALKLFPDAVEAAAMRAMQPLPHCPTGPQSEPAAVFAPALLAPVLGTPAR